MSYLNRRDFVKLSLLAAAGALLAGCDGAVEDGALPAQNPGSTSSQASVLVIGAGMAGLGAARTLQDAGMQVTLLEGRSRIGGLVCSSREWPHAPVDMGAGWIQGTQDNPLTQLARQAGASTLATDFENVHVYDRDGIMASENDLEDLEQYGDEVLEACTNLDDGDDDYPVQEAIDEYLAGEGLSAEERRYLNFYISIVLEGEMAASTTELSAQHTDDSEGLGGESVLFPQGYDQLASYLAKGLDIRLDHKVQKIAYDGRGVTIVTTQGEFSARHAIITLPLGILKSGKVAFASGLPGEKKEAIQTLGFGLLNKTYLRFPKAFWPKEPDGLGYVAADKGEWAGWINFYHYINQPILLAFNSAGYARTLEAKSDRETVALAMNALKTMYGSGIPQPQAWQISRWASDPFALGSYSYNAVGASVEMRRALSNPIEDRLFFAGEATSIKNPSTVHGAYLSGLREAERILAL